MKRKPVFLLAVSMTILLSACQSEPPQPGEESTGGILQKDIGRTEPENVPGEGEEHMTVNILIGI